MLGTNYNVAICNNDNIFRESHESDQNNTLNYITGDDHAQDTGVFKLTYNMVMTTINHCQEK